MKRIAACFLAVLMALSIPGGTAPVFALELLSEEPEPADEERTDSSAGAAAADPEAEAASLADWIMSLDPEELEKALDTILNAVSSESFQSLIVHKEVQDLILTILNKAKDFVLEEPDLAKQICDKIGIPEAVLCFLSEGLMFADSTKEELEQYIGSENETAAIEAASLLLHNPDIQDKLNQIAGYLKEVL